VSKRIRAVRSLRRLSKHGLQYGCGKLGCKVFCHSYILPANTKKNKEPTSGLEPLTCSSYE
jgi:hypothetical protein